MAEYKVGLNLVKRPTKEYSAKEIKDWFFNGTRKSKELIVTDEVVDIINATIIASIIVIETTQIIFESHPLHF